MSKTHTVVQTIKQIRASLVCREEQETRQR